MKNLSKNIQEHSKGKSEKNELLNLDLSNSTKINKEKEIVEDLRYKLGLSEDELFTYIDSL